MPYAAILVPVNADPSTEPRLHLAAALANRLEARLIGVGAESWRAPFVADPLTGGYAAAELIALEEGQVQADLGCAKAQFEAAAQAVTAGSEWRQAIQSPLAEVLGVARAADLIVTSHPHDHGPDPMAIGLAALVLQAGRPVLIAPPHAAQLKLQTVLVAWKDAREARRAVSDALPLLSHADTVIVAEICPHAEEPAASDRLHQVCDHLRRHGVRAQSKVSVEQRGVAPADQLLELVEQVRPDLIVAGAYGHSRLQEWVFGGFTRALMTQTGRAVLLSH